MVDQNQSASASFKMFDMLVSMADAKTIIKMLSRKKHGGVRWSFEVEDLGTSFERLAAHNFLGYESVDLYRRYWLSPGEHQAFRLTIYRTKA